MAMVTLKSMSIFMFMAMIIMSASQSTHAIPDYRCFEAVEPCLGFLSVADTSNHHLHQNPSDKCCQSIHQLYHLAPMVEERREICEHFKRMAASYGLKPEKAEELREKCGFSFEVPIRSDVDCSS